MPSHLLDASAPSRHPPRAGLPARVLQDRSQRRSRDLSGETNETCCQGARSPSGSGQHGFRTLRAVGGSPMRRNAHVDFRSGRHVVSSWDTTQGNYPATIQGDWAEAADERVTDEAIGALTRAVSVKTDDVSGEMRITPYRNGGRRRGSPRCWMMSSSLLDRPGTPRSGWRSAGRLTSRQMARSGCRRMGALPTLVAAVHSPRAVSSRTGT